MSSAPPIIRPAGPISTRASSWRWPAVLLAAAMAYYVAGVLTLAAARQGEVEPVLFARLLATGHMGQFVDLVRDRPPPADTWARATAWQRFERLEDRGVWRRIAQDSGRYEAHPPFFFWLMHAALLSGVPDHWLTTVINLPAALATGLLVVAVTADVARDRWCATLAGVCWFLSPLVMTSGDAVRSPTLFAPLTLLLLWLTLDWARRPRGGTAWRAAATVGLAVVGMLNHFEMAVALAACGLFLLWRDRRAFAVYTAAVVVAAGLFLLIDPYAVHSLAFNQVANDFEPITVRNLADRAVKVVIGLLHFLAMEPKWTRGVTLVIPLALAAGWLTRRVTRDGNGVPTTPRPVLIDAARLTAVVLAVDTLMYLTWRLPRHAYGTNYFPGLIVLTPLWLGIGLVRWVRWPVARGGLLALLFVSSLGSARQWLVLYSGARATSSALGSTDLFLTDAVRIHGIPRYVQPVRPDAWVLAAPRDRLADTLAGALADHRSTAVLLDSDQAKASDALATLLDAAVRAGTLRPERGMAYFAPNFDLYVTPSR